jgi:hypothetical protein
MNEGDAGPAENAARVGWTTHLEFWDVVFAMIGFAVAGLTRAVLVHGFFLFWWGAPLAFVVARRAWFPQLSRRRDAPRLPLSLGRRVAAYVLMVFGGFLALLGGVIFYVAATNAEHPEFVWPALVVAGVGALIATPGVRWVT